MKPVLKEKSFSYSYPNIMQITGDMHFRSKCVKFWHIILLYFSLKMLTYGQWSCKLREELSISWPQSILQISCFSISYGSWDCLEGKTCPIPCRACDTQSDHFQCGMYLLRVQCSFWEDWCDPRADNPPPVHRASRKTASYTSRDQAIAVVIVKLRSWSWKSQIKNR